MIEILPPAAFEEALPDLAETLRACVEEGASVNFLRPFSTAQAEVFWRDKVQNAQAKGRRVLFVARHAGRIRGTVQLDLDMPPNQPHRAEVAKLLVHPEARRRGLARALLQALELEAKARGRSLLCLDTVPQDAGYPLYVAQGFQRAGEVPGFSLLPDGKTLSATCYMYKHLET